MTVLVMVLLFSPRPVSAWDEIDTEKVQKLQAVYLYNFGRFIEWPDYTYAQTNNQFVIGVLGKTPLTSVLDEIAEKKTISRKKIRVTRFDSLEDYTTCHILFIPPDQEAKVRKSAIQKLSDDPVLLVGNSPEFATQGGSMNFILTNDSVGFECNTRTLKTQNLKVNAQLLRLARKVP